MSRTYRVNSDTDSRRDYSAENLSNHWRSSTRNSAKIRKQAKRELKRLRRRNNLTNQEARNQPARINAVAFYW